MHAFAQALAIPKNEPLIFAGDFNVDNVSYPHEVSNLVRLLDANRPIQVGENQFTIKYV